MVAYTVIPRRRAAI